MPDDRQPRRLRPEQRRDQLMDVGERIFAELPFDEISMELVAEEAGVTRALVYHYYRTKAEFFGAIWARAHERLREPAGAAAATTVRDHVEVGLVGYLAFYRHHLPLVVVANRSPIADDPAVRGPVATSFGIMRSLVLDECGARGAARRRAEVAYDAWIAFVRESSLAAYLDRRISHRDNLALCLDALDATVGRHVDLHSSTGSRQHGLVDGQ